MTSSISKPLAEFVDNTVTSSDHLKFVYTLKIDETYNDEQVTWNPLDKMYGICYEHGQEEDITFSLKEFPR